MQFVPCNLHIQVLRVSECGGSGHFSEQNGSGQFSEHKGSTNVSGQPPKENCYVTVTFGAASDHVSGFKHGGVKALLKEARNQSDCVFCRDIGNHDDTVPLPQAELHLRMSQVWGDPLSTWQD